jgi:hypothetical protein
LSHTQRQLNALELAESGIGLIIAGNDTSGLGVTALLAVLPLFPEVLQKMRAEQQQVGLGVDIQRMHTEVCWGCRGLGWARGDCAAGSAAPVSQGHTEDARRAAAGGELSANIGTHQKLVMIMSCLPSYGCRCAMWHTFPLNQDHCAKVWELAPVCIGS